MGTRVKCDDLSAVKHWRKMCFFRVGRNTHGRRFSLYFPYYLGETFFFWHFDRPIRVRLRKSAFIENGAESEGFFLFFLQICREHVYLIKKKKKTVTIRGKNDGTFYEEKKPKRPRISAIVKRVGVMWQEGESFRRNASKSSRLRGRPLPRKRISSRGRFLFA